MAAGQTSVIGTAPTEAISTDFGDIANQILDNNLKLQDYRDRKKAERQAESAKLFEQYGFDESLSTLEGSEFRTVDDATTSTIHKLRDRYYDVYKNLEQNPNDLEGKKRLGKITSTIKNIRSSYEKMRLIGEDFKTKIENDEISGIQEDEWQEILESTDEGRFEMQLDKDDNLQFIFYDRPVDGQPAPIGKIMSYKDLIQGQLMKKVNVQDEVDNIVESFGAVTTTDAKGGFLVTTTELSPEQEAIASETIFGQFEDEDIIADVLNQMNGSTKVKGFGRDEKKMAHDYLMGKIKARFGRKETKTQLRQKSTSSSGSSKGTLSPQDNIKLAVNPSDGSALINEKGTGFTLKEGIQLAASDKNAKIDEIFMDNDGNLSYRGEQKRKVEAENLTPEDKKLAADNGVTGDAQTIADFLNSDKSPRPQTETVFVTLDGDDTVTANKIASRAGFNNAFELKQFLSTLINSNPNKPKAY